MSHSKRKAEETKSDRYDIEAKRARSASSCDTPSTRYGTASSTGPDTMRKTVCPVRIGGSIRSCTMTKLGTIGPIVQATDTDEYYFLTSRHILGPYQEPQSFKGTGVVMDLAADDKYCYTQADICGEVVASEYSEEIDVALVKINRSHLAARCQFLRMNEEEMKTAGLYMTKKYHFEVQHQPINEEFLMSQDMKKQRLIKFGCPTGVSMGKLHLIDNKPVTSTYQGFTKKSPEGNKLEVLTYKNQYLVVPDGCDEFATDADVGAAVYFVDAKERLHCFGMVCELYDKNKAVLITPIQNILENLGEQMGKTLKIAALNFDDETTIDGELLDPVDVEVYHNALKEGYEHDRHLRVNIIGFYGQGKTTLTRRLLSESIEGVESTDGIDIHIRKCIIQGESWKICETKHDCKEFARRLIVAANTRKETNKQQTECKEHEEKLDTSKSSETESMLPLSSNQSNPSAMKSKLKNVRFFREFIEQRVDTEKADILEEEILATIWDFGGQYIYYATHQIFHSRDAIYLLVFDLTLDLENILEDEDFPNRQEKMKNSLKFWVNSINAFVGTEDGKYPKIILVGTHADEFGGNVDEQFAKVKDLFAGTEVRNHIHTQSFAVANVDMTDSYIHKLRKTIYQLGREHAARQTVPAKWLPLEMALFSESKTPILQLNEILKIDKENDFPIRDEKEIKTFLKHHHEKGTLIFFDEEELREYIIIDPHFLTSAFKSIISSKDICAGNNKLFQQWKKMTNQAVLEKELLDSVWQRDPQFKIYENVLLIFLKKHRILAEILEMDEQGDVKGLSKYIVPSLLKTHCKEDTTRAFLDGKTSTDEVLVLTLNNSVVLSTVYEKVTAAALGKWPPIKFKGQNLVFQNVGYYRLDLQHVGKIAISDEYFELLVINQCSKEIDSTECDRFRRYVEMVIAYEFRKLHRDVREKPYSRHFKCNHHKHCGKASENFHPVESLSKEKRPNVCCPDNYGGHCFNIEEAFNKWGLESTIPKTHHTATSKLTEEQLGKIAGAIGNDWETLGIALGIHLVCIEQIKLESKTTVTAVLKMLKRWTEDYPEVSNLQYLRTKMEEAAVTVEWDTIRNMLDGF